MSNTTQTRERFINLRQPGFVTDGLTTIELVLSRNAFGVESVTNYRLVEYGWPRAAGLPTDVLDHDGLMAALNRVGRDGVFYLYENGMGWDQVWHGSLWRYLTAAEIAAAGYTPTPHIDIPAPVYEASR